MRSRIGGAGVALGVSAVIAAGCAGSPRSGAGDVLGGSTPGRSASGDPCLVVPPSPTPQETVTVAVEAREFPWAGPTIDARDPAIPRGASHAPAFVIAQMYETLVRVTCEGRVLPSIAASWVDEPSGTTTTFTLQPGARFPDGQPITASAVAASWRRRTERGSSDLGLTPTAIAGGGAPADDRRLSVSGPAVRPGAPTVFGHLSLAVGGAMEAPGWPAPSGRYVLDTARRGEEIVLRPAEGGAGPVLVILAAPVIDQRDLIDRGVDIIQTRDAAVIDYARRTGSHEIYALPWDYAYVLVLPSRASMAPAPETDRVAAAAFREALARDALRRDARAAEVPAWWQIEPPCAGWAPLPGSRDSAPAGNPGGRTPRRVLYEPGDPVGRALAERLVALAGQAGAPPHAATLARLAPELTGTGPATAAPFGSPPTGQGPDIAYVVAVPRQATGQCMVMRRLEAKHPGISPRTMIPLVEVRPTLLRRRGGPAMSIDWDGNLRVHPSGVPRGDPR